MLDPKAGHNKTVIQDWADKFWKINSFIWIPLLVFYKVFISVFKKNQNK
ncbi:MAG: hypothetical protein ABIC19_02360 [Patescibacteria group bacterium]|nr:hypothetical protein [Patescibacteria group bacterium]